MRRINTRAALIALVEELSLGSDWHEPGAQDVTARVFGKSFDNAGFWGDDRLNGEPHEELHVELYKDGEPIAVVNLATLFAWATGFEG